MGTLLASLRISLFMAYDSLHKSWQCNTSAHGFVCFIYRGAVMESGLE